MLLYKAISISALESALDIISFPNDERRAMEFDNFIAQDSPGWGVTSPKTGDIVRDAIKKEQVLKEILSCQDDLRVMLSKVDSVQKSVDKLVSENETLQMYIDNLTVQMARRR